MNYTIVEGRDQIGAGEAERLLKMTYWADKRTTETIERSMRNSTCFGIRTGEDGMLVGFARVISDYATTWYLCDVIIDPAYQHQGLGKTLVSHIVSRFSGLRGILLTRDAHGLYEQYGFASSDGRAMTRNPDKGAGR